MMQYHSFCNVGLVEDTDVLVYCVVICSAAVLCGPDSGTKVTRCV